MDLLVDRHHFNKRISSYLLIVVFLVVFFFFVSFDIISKGNSSLKSLGNSKKRFINNSGINIDGSSTDSSGSFDGSRYYRVEETNFYSHYLIATWLLPESASDSSAKMIIASFNDPSSKNAFSASLYYDINKKRVCFDGTSGNTHRVVCSSYNSVKMNQWTHIAFEFTEYKKPVSKVNVYIDGVMDVNNQIVPRYYKQLMILIGGDIQTRSNYYGQLNTFLICNADIVSVSRMNELAMTVGVIPSSFDRCDGAYFVKTIPTVKPNPPKVEQTSHSKETSSNNSILTSLKKAIMFGSRRDYLEDYIKRPAVYESNANLRTSYPLPPKKEGMCENTPPADIPELTPQLKEFVTFLQTESNKDEIRTGKFEYQVPDDLKEDYHNLNEYRSQNVRNAFCFAWANYRERAWGLDEIQPKSGQGNNNWGGVGMTIIDTIDTLLLMGLDEEEKKAREFVKDVSFDKDRMNSLFETTIRVLGGLLAAYDMTKEKVYLDKAEDIANRMLPAFNTRSGYPKGSVNFHTGYATNPSWTGGKAILAEIGTVSLEYLYLSNATGNKDYKTRIDRIYESLEKAQTWDGLLSTLMDVDTGAMSGGSYTMSGSADSYYEYLIKMWIQSGKKDERVRKLYVNAVEGMTKHLMGRSTSGLLYLSETYGGQLGTRMGHLACFAGGMLALGVMHGVNPSTAKRDMENAKALGYTCYQMYMSTATGVGGEDMVMNGDRPYVNQGATYYILRPEAVETLYYLNQITGDPIYREWGWEMWKNIERNCKTTYGYGHLQNVDRLNSVEDRAESFFFAETAKYLYLLFKDDKAVDLTKKVFNTEAHPLSVF